MAHLSNLIQTSSAGYKIGGVQDCIQRGSHYVSYRLMYCLLANSLPSLLLIVPSSPPPFHSPTSSLPPLLLLPPPHPLFPSSLPFSHPLTPVLLPYYRLSPHTSTQTSLVSDLQAAGVYDFSLAITIAAFDVILIGVSMVC